MENVALKIQRRRYSGAAVYEVAIHHLVQRETGGCGDIVAMREAFLHDGHVCMAFEKHGRSLDETLSPRPLPLPRAKSVTRQLLRAVAALHRCGYAHTDIKPDNILYDARTGHARLADLGSAEKELSQGTTFGTREYMAPELIVGAPMGLSLDMWSLGCTVFEILTGRQLFNPRRTASKKYREFSDGKDAIEVPLGESAKADLAAEAAEQFTPGAILAGKYELGKILGRGHFGSVWVARKLNDSLLDGSYATLWGYAENVRQNSPAETGATDRDRDWRRARGADDLLDLVLNYEYLTGIIRLCGALTGEMIQSAQYRASYFNEEGTVRFHPMLRRTSLRTMLRRSATFSSAELDPAVDFISALLAVSADARPSAEAALNHPWLKPHR